MKKKTIFMLLSIFLLSGCMTKGLGIKNPSIVSYNNIEIVSEDYKNIIKKLNKITFDEEKDLDFLEGNTVNFVIEQDDITYSFIFVNDYICYEVSGSEDGIYNCGKTNDLKEDLDTLYKDYIREDYYSIEYVPNNTDLMGGVIEIDDTNNAIILNITEEANLEIDSITLTDKDTLTSQNIETIENAKGKYIINIDLDSNPKISIKLMRVESVYKVLMPILDENNNMTFYGLE